MFRRINYSASSSLFLIAFKIAVTSHITILKSKAHPNPLTSKPSMNQSANKIINVFITIRNNPKLKITAGKANSMSNGFRKTFRNPRTTATIIAVRKFSTYTPGKT